MVRHSPFWPFVYLHVMEMMDAKCIRVELSQYSVEQIWTKLLDKGISCAKYIKHHLIVPSALILTPIVSMNIARRRISLE